MSDDSDGYEAVPLPHLPAGSRAERDDDSPLKMEIPIPPLPPSSPTLEEIPYPGETNLLDPVELEIPLPPTTDPSRYSPTQATTAGDESPESKKVPTAVLGKQQAKKRLMAFSASKITSTALVTPTKKGSPFKGISVFNQSSGGKNSSKPLAIDSIREEETKMKEILAMNSILNEKLKQVNAITTNIPTQPPATAIVKPTLIMDKFRVDDLLPRSPVLEKPRGFDTFKIKSKPNLRKKHNSSSKSRSRSRSKSKEMKPQPASQSSQKKRSRSRDRERNRGDRDRTDRDRMDRERNERDRERREKRVGGGRRSRSREKERTSSSNKDQSRDRDPKERERDPKERDRDPKERERDLRERERDPKGRGREGDRKSRSRSRDRHRRRHSPKKEVNPKESMVPMKEVKESKVTKPAEERAKIKDEPIDIPVKSSEKDRQKSEKEKKPIKVAPIEAEEKKMDKVKSSKMPQDWADFKTHQFSHEDVRTIWSEKESRNDSKSGRSLSPSEHPPRSPPSGKEDQPTPLSKSLNRPIKEFGLIQIEDRSGLMTDYPAFLVKKTKTKPSISFGYSPLTFSGYYKTRKETLEIEDSSIVQVMEQTMAQTSSPMVEEGHHQETKEWFASNEKSFCPSEGSKKIVISHLYSDDESSESSKFPLAKSPIKQDDEGPVGSDMSMDSVPSPLLKKRYSDDSSGVKDSFVLEKERPIEKSSSKSEKKHSGSGDKKKEKRSEKIVEVKKVHEEDLKKESSEELEMEVDDAIPHEKKKKEGKEKKKDKKSKKKKKKHHRHAKGSKKDKETSEDEGESDKNSNEDENESKGKSKDKSTRKRKVKSPDQSSDEEVEVDPPKKSSTKKAKIEEVKPVVSSKNSKSTKAKPTEKEKLPEKEKELKEEKTKLKKKKHEKVVVEKKKKKRSRASTSSKTSESSAISMSSGSSDSESSSDSSSEEEKRKKRKKKTKKSKNSKGEKKRDKSPGDSDEDGKGSRGGGRPSSSFNSRHDKDRDRPREKDDKEKKSSKHQSSKSGSSGRKRSAMNELPLLLDVPALTAEEILGIVPTRSSLTYSPLQQVISNSSGEARKPRNAQELLTSFDDDVLLNSVLNNENLSAQDLIENMLLNSGSFSLNSNTSETGDLNGDVLYNRDEKSESSDSSSSTSYSDESVKSPNSPEFANGGGLIEEKYDPFSNMGSPEEELLTTTKTSDGKEKIPLEYQSGYFPNMSISKKTENLAIYKEVHDGMSQEETQFLEENIRDAKEIIEKTEIIPESKKEHELDLHESRISSHCSDNYLYDSFERHVESGKSEDVRAYQTEELLTRKVDYEPDSSKILIERIVEDRDFEDRGGLEKMKDWDHHLKTEKLGSSSERTQYYKDRKSLSGRRSRSRSYSRSRSRSRSRSYSPHSSQRFRVRRGYDEYYNEHRSGGRRHSPPPDRSRHHGRHHQSQGRERRKRDSSYSRSRSRSLSPHGRKGFDVRRRRERDDMTILSRRGRDPTRDSRESQRHEHERYHHYDQGHPRLREEVRDGELRHSDRKDRRESQERYSEKERPREVRELMEIREPRERTHSREHSRERRHSRERGHSRERVRDGRERDHYRSYGRHSRSPDPREFHDRRRREYDHYDHEDHERRRSDNESPPLQLNVADSTISDAELAARGSELFCGMSKEIFMASEAPMHHPMESYHALTTTHTEYEQIEGPGNSSPRRLSLDERLEMEMGISLREENSGMYYGMPGLGNKFLPQDMGKMDHYYPGAGPNLEGGQMGRTMFPPHGHSHSRHSKSQIVQRGNVIQIVPSTDVPTSPITISSNGEIQHHTPHLGKLDGSQQIDSSLPKTRIVTIKVPVVPFTIPFVVLPPVAEIEEKPIITEEEIKAQKARRLQRKMERLAKRDRQMKSAMAVAAANKKHSEEVMIENESKNFVEEKVISGSCEVEEMKEPMGEDASLLQESPLEKGEGEKDSSPAEEYLAQPNEENRDEGGEEKEPPAVVEPPLTDPLKETEKPKGILVSLGFREKTERPRRGVKFADGIIPGEGSEGSDHEMPMSPPPGEITSEASSPKKKKMKMIKRKKRSRKDLDPELFEMAPPPPPKSPYPFCHPGILYQVSPQYAVLYGKAVAEKGFQIVFSFSNQAPSLEKNQGEFEGEGKVVRDLSPQLVPDPEEPMELDAPSPEVMEPIDLHTSPSPTLRLSRVPTVIEIKPASPVDSDHFRFYTPPQPEFLPVPEEMKVEVAVEEDEPPPPGTSP